MQHKDRKETNKEDPNENGMDLTFCFEAIVSIEEALNKLNYIEKFSYSNSDNVISNSIGQQIENKMKVQRDLEKKFEDLIVEKSGKTELLEENKINELVKQIQDCAEELKKSTNDICKSLAESPDIPTNLLKAKEDMKIVTGVLHEIKSDMINGSSNKFNEIINNIVKKSIKIEDKRTDEMRLFKHLRILNEELSKEEAEYLKDTKNLENRLAAEKKKLAKTKMEENIFKDYRKNQIEALRALKKTNFSDYELSLRNEITDKFKEKDKTASLDNQVIEFLKDQTYNLVLEKQRWDNVKLERDNENNNDRKFFETKKHNKKSLIEKYEKQIKQFDEEIDKKKNLGLTLTSKNITTHIQINANKPETKESTTVIKSDEN